jgi:hypothetical protein
MNQNYLIIENNVVTNIVVWDGGSGWQPPIDSIAIALDTTPSIIWQPNTDRTDWVLTEIMGQGQIGFTWNGSNVTTNAPKPPLPIPTEPLTNNITTI